MIFPLHIYFLSQTTVWTTLQCKCDTFSFLPYFLKSIRCAVKLGLDKAIFCEECHLFWQQLKTAFCKISEQSATVLVETTDTGAFLGASTMHQLSLTNLTFFMLLLTNDTYHHSTVISQHIGFASRWIAWKLQQAWQLPKTMIKKTTFHAPCSSLKCRVSILVIEAVKGIQMYKDRQRKTEWYRNVGMLLQVLEYF